MKKRIELLAPAGNVLCFEAALQNGADAIYIGGSKFSARAFADNFTNEQIIACVKRAHLYGVSIYVGINTIISESDFTEAISYIDFLYENDVDGIIVCDLGLLNVIKNRYKNFRIHVSTQLNTFSLSAVKQLEQLGVNRIVLARETSIDVVKEITAASPIEIEVFGHGALCFSYSGNCLHSSMIGKRSGNKGECAQPCRIQYTLFDGNKPVSNNEYLLSMKDLCTIEDIDNLIESGITSLKIEGRMKSPEYVAVVTSTYRKAIDNYYRNTKYVFDKNDKKELKQIFSRDFTKGYINREKPNNIVNKLRPNNMGVNVGEVIGRKGSKVQIKLCENIFQKDKIVFLTGNDFATHITKIYSNGYLVNCGKKGETVELEISSSAPVNTKVNKVESYEQITRANATFTNANIRKVPVSVKVIAGVDKKFAIIIKDREKNSVSAESEEILQSALKCVTSSLEIEKQIRSLPNCAYAIENFDIVYDNAANIPYKIINKVKKEAIEKLDNVRQSRYGRNIADIVSYVTPKIDKVKTKTGLKVKVNSLAQLQAIADLPLQEIYYTDLNTFLTAKNLYKDANITLVTPRVYDNTPTSIETRQYLVSDLGSINYLKNHKLISDTYLNVVNHHAIEYLLVNGVNTVTLSSELNKNEINSIISNFVQEHYFVPPVEMIVHGRVQNMVSKHCVINSALNLNNDHCQLCKKGRYSIVDNKHYAFPVMGDSNCNMIIYNCRILCLIDYLDEIISMGVNSLRIDFSIEDPETVSRITNAYLSKMAGNDITLDEKDLTFGYYKTL